MATHDTDYRGPSPVHEGDMGDVLQKQGYSQQEIAKMQRILDDENAQGKDIEQLPMPMLRSHARALDIDAGEGTTKSELVEAIRSARN